jgi:CubicO group peptidase (beta-lactamase class C family)
MMSRLFHPTRIQLTVLSLLFALIFAWTSAIHAQEATPEDPISRIDTFLSNLAESDIFSGAVLVARGDEILLNEGYGLADREWNVPNTADSKFRIGSITKQFTAVAILMLQERGLLSVQDPICNYVEDCPDAWADITIHHLLTHTSGIQSFTDFIDYASTQTLTTNVSGLIDRFIDRPLRFEPGTDWYYSNSGYVLLGHIIQEVSDDRYRSFLKENIFDPLEMADTDYDVNDAVVENRARGYQSSGRNADYINMTVPFAAGALYSTTGDLFKWVRGLVGGQIISTDTLEASFDAGVPIPPESSGVRYAYGLALSEFEGHQAIWHDGGINGFVTSLAYLPDDDVTIVVLSNLESANPSQIVHSSITMLFGES